MLLSAPTLGLRKVGFEAVPAPVPCWIPPRLIVVIWVYGLMVPQGMTRSSLALVPAEYVLYVPLVSVAVIFFMRTSPQAANLRCTAVWSLKGWGW